MGIDFVYIKCIRNDVYYQDNLLYKVPLTLMFFCAWRKTLSSRDQRRRQFSSSRMNSLLKPSPFSSSAWAPSKGAFRSAIGPISWPNEPWPVATPCTWSETQLGLGVVLDHVDVSSLCRELVSSIRIDTILVDYRKSTEISTNCMFAIGMTALQPSSYNSVRLSHGHRSFNE